MSSVSYVCVGGVYFGGDELNNLHVVQQIQKCSCCRGSQRYFFD